MLFRSRWQRQMLYGSCLLFRSTPVTACFVATAHFVTFCHHGTFCHHRDGDKSCCQRIRFDTFCHGMFCHHGTFCHHRDGDKSCCQCIKFDTFCHGMFCHQGTFCHHRDGDKSCCQWIRFDTRFVTVCFVPTEHFVTIQMVTNPAPSASNLTRFVTLKG